MSSDLFKAQWPQLRNAFAHTQQQVYLNHAAVSPFSQPVKTAVEAYAQERNTDTIENYDLMMERIEQLRWHLASLVGGTASSIALVENTSAGLNLLASGVAWKTGDRVLLNTLEFPSNVYPFMNLRTQGVEIDFVKPQEHYLALEDIIAAITPRTRLLSISHVQFLTGQRHDLAALGKICHEKNIIFCVDAIQSLGALRLDARALHIDFLAAGGHKWLMGPQGQGFVYISPELLQQLTPRHVGWLSVEDSWSLLDYQLTLKEDASRYEMGTPNGMGITALLAARKFLDGFASEGLTQHILDLTGLLIQGFKERGIELITPESARERLGIVTADHEDADALQAALKARQVKVASREGRYLRVSPHGYNSAEDIEAFFTHLDLVS